MNSLTARIAARFAQGVLVVFAAATIAFVLLHLAPGDPFTEIGTAGSTPALQAQQRQKYGLDQPVLTQYVRWLTIASTGDFGVSLVSEVPVVDAIANALPNTLLLMGLAFAASLVCGVLLGAWQGAHAGSRADHVVSTATLGAYSLPEFFLGVALMAALAKPIGFLPTGGAVSDAYAHLDPMAQLVDRLEHLVLPWLSLTAVGTAMFARYQRAVMRDTMRDDFVRTARAKGLDERVVRRHALRASLLPVITTAGTLFPAIVGGAVLVERVFAWPGMGSLIFDAIGKRDYLLVAAGVIVISAMTALGSFLAETARTVADPRVVHAS